MKTFTTNIDKTLLEFYFKCSQSKFFYTLIFIKSRERRKVRQKRRQRDDIITYIGTTLAKTAQDRGQ